MSFRLFKIKHIDKYVPRVNGCSKLQFRVRLFFTLFGTCLFSIQWCTANLDDEIRRKTVPINQGIWDKNLYLNDQFIYFTKELYIYHVTLSLHIYFRLEKEKNIFMFFYRKSSELAASRFAHPRRIV